MAGLSNILLLSPLLLGKRHAYRQVDAPEGTHDRWGGLIMLLALFVIPTRDVIRIGYKDIRLLAGSSET